MEDLSTLLCSEAIHMENKVRQALGVDVTAAYTATKTSESDIVVVVDHIVMTEADLEISLLLVQVVKSMNRKSSVKLIALDDKGNPLANATFSIKQQRPNFPFGCVMKKNILTNTGYQNWFRSRFTVTTFGNAMKWYSTEPYRGREDYSVPDAMLQFASSYEAQVLQKWCRTRTGYLPGAGTRTGTAARVPDTANSVSVRLGELVRLGYTVGTPGYGRTQLFRTRKRRNREEMREERSTWFEALTAPTTYDRPRQPSISCSEHGREETEKRGEKRGEPGKVIAWDVVNENLHFHFFESKLGPNASAIFFNDVHRLDPGAMLFLNDYNTIEQSGDVASSPARYLQKFLQIRSGGYRGPIAIGLESHFSTPNIPYMRAAIDKLGATGLPIWLTEVDIQGPNQATFLDQVLSEGYSHPSINGIIVWAAWSPEGCYHMCLTDNNFRNLPTGDAVDRLISEWSHSGLSAGTTDSNGHFKTRLFHGDYEVTITHPNMVNSSVTRKFKVAPIKKSQQKSLHVKVSA
ncbi:hypothetical protein HYC85_009782 [Camellia sinensis]|uniref:GH10 domain-containing protein n=1 Tax=Camellia sinensis TaxID=4442 RepID=A0A7J7HIM0_CAMSI|nr:hypothetical protein HYC85_009782 [Camellia sinensis]